MIDLKPVRGTRDFYPAELRLRHWLFDIWRGTARQFGFEEYDACVLESEALYVRKAGDEITGQLYNFDDKGGRRLALRPEMTPTLARLILQRQRALQFPLKWFSIPQCFRYERMTRGRKREHYQWNLDVIGQPGNVAEVETISALIASLEAMGLTAEHVRLHLNDRRLLTAVLERAGVPEELHLPVMVVMDKRDKIGGEQLEALLGEQGLSGTQVRRIDEFLAMSSLEEVKAALGGDAPAVAELEALQELLGRVGFGDWVGFDITVVRGLSYYTGTVFELRDRSASLRAICGGGRYDSLLSAFGGDPIPAIGFGFGDVVILELLGDLGLLPQLGTDLDYVVIPFSDAQVPAALELSQKLRRKGLRVDADFALRKLKRALQRASEIGARRAVLLMPDELERGEVVVRDMAKREERRVAMEAFLEE
ncbi:MAG: histidine--tRNA ligase [SAR324 cluster bacterium]|nr:histidine--tRNA ligase [SAR324 cluster bacterium]